MKKIRYLVLDEPALYLLGALVSVTLLAFSFSFNQATTVLFWWYLACAVTVGFYMVWCNFIALMMSLVDKDTPPGWNLNNRPSLQELRGDDPELARVLGEMHDLVDRVSWISAFFRLVWVITIFVSLPVGAFFLRESIMEVIVWWKFALALVLLAFGFVMHHQYNR